MQEGGWRVCEVVGSLIGWFSVGVEERSGKVNEGLISVAIAFRALSSAFCG